MGHVRNSPGTCLRHIEDVKGGRHRRRKSERHTRSVQGIEYGFCHLEQSTYTLSETCLLAYGPRPRNRECLFIIMISIALGESKSRLVRRRYLSQSILHGEIFFYSNEEISSESLCIPPSFCAALSSDYDLLELNDISNSFLMANVRYLVSPVPRFGERKNDVRALFVCGTIYSHPESLVVARSLSIRRLGTSPPFVPPVLPASLFRAKCV